MEKEDKKKRLITCFRCKKRIAGKPEDITFEYEGLKFTVFKSGLDCVDCAKKEFIEKFERNGRQLVSLQEGKIKIDWPIYSKAYDEDSASVMSDILLSIGIFSHDSEGSWEIVADGPIGLNPRSRLCLLYFTREEDAVRFAGLNYSDTLYSWEIRHVDRVISKEQTKAEK